MAKKRFTDDLIGLFEDNSSELETVQFDVPAPTARAKKKLSSKKFTQNLDAFFTDKAEPAPQRRRRRTGLDYLIRSTVDKDDEDTAADKKAKADTKRVTLIFNKEHLVTLKQQAKERNMYLKDVVQEMVAEYLSEQ